MNSIKLNSELNSLKLTKFGTISENEKGELVLSGFEFEGDEDKTVKTGGAETNEIVNLIIERIKEGLK